MITAFQLVFGVVQSGASGRGGGEGACSGSSASRRAEGGQLADDGGIGLSHKGAEGREAADDDAGGEFGGAVGEERELDMEFQDEGWGSRAYVHKPMVNVEYVWSALLPFRMLETRRKILAKGALAHGQHGRETGGSRSRRKEGGNWDSHRSAIANAAETFTFRPKDIAKVQMEYCGKINRMTSAKML